MSVREEDRQNKNCPSRGLGLATVAIGVGVGAALYYFFSKRPENPDEEGSTSTMGYEQAQTFTEDEFENSRHENLTDDSYTTLSEHSTTDTSIHTSPLCENCNYNNNEDSQFNSDGDNETSQYISDDDDDQTSDSLMSVMESISSISSEAEVDSDSSDSEETSIIDDNSNESGSLMNGTDVNTSLEESVNNNYQLPNIFDCLQDLLSFTNNRNGRGRLTEEEQMERARVLSEEEQIKFLRDQAFRERSWSLEECSICFEVILKNQEVMSLPCTHHFHTACILPWLQEQQTCPNCRKAAE